LTQLTVENANHGQLFNAAITLMLSEPPPVGKVTCSGTAEYMHPTVDADGTNRLTSLAEAFPEKYRLPFESMVIALGLIAAKTAGPPSPFPG
jgi:hypothetical protein